MLKNFCSNYGNESCFTSKCKNGMCKSIFSFFLFSIFELCNWQWQRWNLEGTTNRFLNKRMNSLFFVLVRPLWVHNGGVTAWPNQSRDRPWLLALLENNKEKKSSYFFRCEKEGGHLFKELCQEALQIDYPYKFLRTNLLTLENSSTLGWNWVSNLEEQPYIHAPPFSRDFCTKIPFYNSTDIEGIDYLLTRTNSPERHLKILPHWNQIWSSILISTLLQFHKILQKHKAMKKLHFLLCAMLNHTQIKAIVRVSFSCVIISNVPHS